MCYLKRGLRLQCHLEMFRSREQHVNTLLKPYNLWMLRVGSQDTGYRVI